MGVAVIFAGTLADDEMANYRGRSEEQRKPWFTPAYPR